MPKVERILETALYVRDVQHAATFYRQIFGFEVLLESDRLVALDVSGQSVLLLFKIGATSDPLTLPGGTVPGHGCTGVDHFAFAVAANDLPAWEQLLTEKGVPVESRMDWPGGAKSLYFRDPDQHVVELITRGFWRSY